MKSKFFTLTIRFFLMIIAILIGYQTFFIIKNAKNPQAHQANMHILPSSLNEEWITVFVHGSFASALGLLSLPKVLEDKIHGTSYRDANKRARDDDYFFTDQPMLKRGLIHIKPTFDHSLFGNKKYAAYPLLKAYETIQEWAFPDKENNSMYLFGWTGLISQNSRRFEAIRLYNALYEEIARLKKQGKTPKIRLIAHSHGGNLCLNLAAVRAGLQIMNELPVDECAHHADAQITINRMLELLKTNKNRSDIANQHGQKKLDYFPRSIDLHIDELILYGAPIQPETQHFFLSPCFKKIYNFYSDEDIVQGGDWVSTRRYFSDQRISPEILDKQKTKKEIPRLVQARIMIGRQWSKEEKTQKKSTPSSDGKTDGGQAPSIWNVLLSGKNTLLRKTQDPTHKELWFALWQAKSLLSPLPAMTFSSIFQALLDQVPECIDADINITTACENLKISVSKFNDHKVRAKRQIPLTLIDGIKVRVQAWAPQKRLPKEETDMMYKYVG